VIFGNDENADLQARGLSRIEHYLVYRLVCSWHMAAGQLATRKNSQLAAAQRLEMESAAQAPDKANLTDFKPATWVEVPSNGGLINRWIEPRGRYDDHPCDPSRSSCLRSCWRLQACQLSCSAIEVSRETEERWSTFLIRTCRVFPRP
jgi:hypothetical protein